MYLCFYLLLAQLASKKKDFFLALLLCFDLKKGRGNSLCHQPHGPIWNWKEQKEWKYLWQQA
jgi:hypothetical protein